MAILPISREKVPRGLGRIKYYYFVRFRSAGKSKKFVHMGARLFTMRQKHSQVKFSFDPVSEVGVMQ